MSKNELVAKIEALNEWEAVIEEAKAEAEAIREQYQGRNNGARHRGNGCWKVHRPLDFGSL